MLRVSRQGTGAQLNRELARILARLEAPDLVSRAFVTLFQFPAQEVRLHGLFILRNIKTGWTPETRRAYFTALNEASTVVGGEGMPRFLSQIREDALKTLTDEERTQLAELLTPQPATNEPLPPQRPLVQQCKIANFEAELSGSTTGDPQRGANIFNDALCSRCHRAGARGPAVGPDLTSLAGRFSRRDMLLSILEPNRVVAENYRNVQIATHDGRQLVGRLAIEGDFRSENLRLATDPLQPSRTVEISKRNIHEYRETQTSPMPQGLLDSFSKQEILDLLAFLESPH
jgi:putative heme-binding domain-containing protein